MRYFLTTNCTIIDNKLFCVEAYGGALVMIEPTSGKSDCYEIMDGFIPRKILLIDFMDAFKGKVYALDSTGRNLVIFDLSKHYCDYVPLNCAYEPKINFVAFERYESDYYIFPKYGNQILKYNIEKNIVTPISKYFDCVDEVQCACRIENNIWVLPKSTGNIYCYRLPDMDVKVYRLGMMLRNCVHACFWNGYIYILEEFGVIYRWDIKKKLLQITTVLESDNDEKKSMSRVVCAGNKIILLPAYGYDIKILDLETKQIEVYKDYPGDLIYYKTNWLKYYGYCEDKEYYYFAMCAGNYTLMIKKQSGELIWMKPVMSMLGEKVVRLLRSCGENVFYEGSLDITDLLNISKVADTSINNGFNFGKNIYGKISV